MANAKTSSEVASEFDGLQDIKVEFPAGNSKASTAKNGAKRPATTAAKGPTAVSSAVEILKPVK